MFVQWLWHRLMAKPLGAFEALDAEGFAASWPEDIVVEFPPGTPMAGEWHGKAQATEVMRALFAQNASARTTLHHVALDHPWSPTGTFTVFIEWSAVEVGIDGQVYEGRLISVAEFRHWKQVRARDYFQDVPGLAAHFAKADIPTRRASADSMTTAA